MNPLFILAVAAPMAIDTPPPMWQREREYPGQEPHFTPYTEPPKLLNRDGVAHALVRNYPKELRDKGIGGTVVIWLYLDTLGTPQYAKVKSSNVSGFDSAALRVAEAMRFFPAVNHDRKVPVWVELPIVFCTKCREAGLQIPSPKN